MGRTPIDLKNCVIEVFDGTPSTPNSIEMVVGEGNITYDESRVIEYLKDRGALDTTRLGDEEPMDVTMDFRWIFLTGSSGDPPTIEDALKKRNEAADWISSETTDPCAPYCVDIKITNTPICDDEEIEVIWLRAFRYEKLGHDPKTGQVSCTGKCNAVEAEVSREPNV